MKLLVSTCMLACTFASASNTTSVSQTACQPLVFKAIQKVTTPRPPVPLFPTSVQSTGTTLRQEQEKESKKQRVDIEIPHGYKIINHVLSNNKRCLFIIAKYEASAQASFYAVLVYDLQEHKYLACAIHPSEIIALAIHPAGIYFATISKAGTVSDRLQSTETNTVAVEINTVAVWETLTGKPRKTWYNLTNVSWVRFMQDKDGISFGGNVNPQKTYPNAPRT